MNSRKKNIAIFGTGDHAKVVVDTIEKMERFNIVGYFDNQKHPGEILTGYPVLGKDEDIEKFRERIDAGILAIGENQIRFRVSQFIKNLIPDFNFFTAIDPFTSISKRVQIDQGAMIIAGAVINSDTKIGKHVIINTKASIDHDNRIGDFAFIAPGVITGGNVTIGKLAFIGIGAIIVPGVTIGEKTIIGAGSTVLCDIPANVLAVGSPAKIIREI